ncbi:hypothetical protein JMUB3936_p1031 (plasmid) [Leptotrichia wadei]|uniref:Uncharacterized protein n=1 Tax=Leptotrichia wadei TaxID=157687 RepID=A0A510KWN2_9FUSO|nr:hypothetical protein JMUB3936_p1031 [Leptotrichia wadei]
METLQLVESHFNSYKWWITIGLGGYHGECRKLANRKNDDKEIDVAIGKNIILSSELEKIRLRLENKLRLFFNEWFLHKNEGIYWLKRNENNGQIGNLLEKFNIEAQVKETILSDEDVAEITKFESDFENRNGNYNFKVEMLLKNGKTLAF